MNERTKIVKMRVKAHGRSGTKTIVLIAKNARDIGRLRAHVLRNYMGSESAIESESPIDENGERTSG